jgi:uncharacterized membrane protein
MDRAKPHSFADESRETARQRKLDSLVGSILQAGVLLSLGLVVTGLCWKRVACGNLNVGRALMAINLFQLTLGRLHLLRQTVVGPRLLVSVGIDVLMLTPYLGVLTSVIYFCAVLKNWKYSLITLVIFAVLTYSLFIHPMRFR